MRRASILGECRRRSEAGGVPAAQRFRPDGDVRHVLGEYNDVEPRPGPNPIPAVRKRLKVRGFIVSDQWRRFGEYRAMAAPLVRSGELKYRKDIVDGLDRAPEAFVGLLQGRNFCKLLVKLGEDPTRGA